MDLITKAIVNAAVLGTPIVIGICWWIWFRRDRALSPRWRVQVLLIGLSAVSANAILYYAWFAYSMMASNSDAPSELKNTLGTYIAIPLVMTALAGAIAVTAPRAFCLRSRRSWDSFFGSVWVFCDPLRKRRRRAAVRLPR